MKNYNIDFANNRIVVTEKFMERAGQLGSAEFAQMMELRKLGMRVEVQKAKPRKKPEFQLTYKKMGAFIRCTEEAEALLAEFEQVKEAAKAQHNPYLHVQKWFKQTFPNFSKVPEMTPDLKVVATPAKYDEDEAA